MNKLTVCKVPKNLVNAPQPYRIQRNPTVSLKLRDLNYEPTIPLWHRVPGDSNCSVRWKIWCGRIEGLGYCKIDYEKCCSHMHYDICVYSCPIDYGLEYKGYSTIRYDISFHNWKNDRIKYTISKADQSPSMHNFIYMYIYICIRRTFKIRM